MTAKERLESRLLTHQYQFEHVEGVDLDSELRLNAWLWLLATQDSLIRCIVSSHLYN